jgi:nocturnin
MQEMQVGQKLRNIWQVPVPAAAAAAAATATAAAPDTAAAAATAEVPAAEAEFTTWKFRPGGEARRTIDYIWFSSGGPLHPLSRWQMPSRTEIGQEALPCETYPSDHLSVCCDFGWASEAVQL